MRYLVFALVALIFTSCGLVSSSDYFSIIVYREPTATSSSVTVNAYVNNNLQDRFVLSASKDGAAVRHPKNSAICLIIEGTEIGRRYTVASNRPSTAGLAFVIETDGTSVTRFEARNAEPGEVAVATSCP